MHRKEDEGSQRQEDEERHIGHGKSQGETESGELRAGTAGFSERHGREGGYFEKLKKLKKAIPGG
jgi:hypothetical protein